MHHLEFVPENEAHKLLWVFEIQTDYLISAIQPDLVISTIQREPAESVLTQHSVKLKESEKRDKYQDLTRELKKL